MGLVIFAIVDRNHFALVSIDGLYRHRAIDISEQTGTIFKDSDLLFFTEYCNPLFSLPNQSEHGYSDKVENDRNVE